MSEQDTDIDQQNRLNGKKDSKISDLNTEVIALKSCLAKYECPEQDSPNSNTPPNKEPLQSEIARRTKSLREKSSRPIGGQKGHKGSYSARYTLSRPSTPRF